MKHLNLLLLSEHGALVLETLLDPGLKPQDSRSLKPCKSLKGFDMGF